MAPETFFGRMFAFAGRPMPPEPTGAFQTTGILLRVLGWIWLVVTALMTVGVLGMVVAVAFFGTLAAAFLDRFVPGVPWLPVVGAAIAAVAIVALLVALIFVILLGGAGLFWVGFTYDHFRKRDPRGLSHLFGLGLTATILGGLSVLGGDFSGVVLLGFGIAFLVLHANTEVKRAFAEERQTAAKEDAPTHGGASTRKG